MPPAGRTAPRGPRRPPRHERSMPRPGNGSLRSCLADFLRHLHQTGQIREDLASRLPPQRYPRRGQTAPYPWTAAQVRLVLDQIDRQSAIGKRDYAMIVLTARLGLRVGDLRRLELRPGVLQVDADPGQLRLRGGKLLAGLVVLLADPVELGRELIDLGLDLGDRRSRGGASAGGDDDKPAD